MWNSTIAQCIVIAAMGVSLLAWTRTLVCETLLPTVWFYAWDSRLLLIRCSGFRRPGSARKRPKIKPAITWRKIRAGFWSWSISCGGKKSIPSTLRICQLPCFQKKLVVCWRLRVNDSPDCVTGLRISSNIWISKKGKILVNITHLRARAVYSLVRNFHIPPSHI